MERLTRFRAGALLGLFGFIMLLYAVRLFDLQIIKTDGNTDNTTLYSTVEHYWLQAVSNQNKFKAARLSTESAQASYDLLSEQFKQGLKNIVELMTGKTNLLQAQQNELQSKYLAILNLNMLEFYKSGEIR